MASVKFRLREPESKTPQRIHLVYAHTTKNGNDVKREKFVYPTEFKVLPDNWSSKTQRIKSTDDTDKDKINSYLNKLIDVFEDFITEQKTKRQPITKDILKQFLDEYHNPEQHKKIVTMFDFIEDYINKSDKRLNERGRDLTQRTILKYKSTLALLKEFDSQYKRKVDFNTIDMDFYRDFVEFMKNYVFGKKKKVKGFSVNTAGRYIKTIKTFMNAALLAGYTNNKAHTLKKFKVLSEKTENVYLTEDELILMYEADLSNNKRLERVRDLFIVGAWTGLRFSDFTRITPDKIIGDELHIEQQKTGEPTIIPLHWTAKKILEKYNNSSPGKISNQKMNDYIKEVCKIVKLTQATHKAITRGGARISKKYEKWELVSSHTARRSFATNLYKLGCPSITIMEVTGHKTEKAFLTYIKLKKSEHANIMRAYMPQPKLKIV